MALTIELATPGPDFFISADVVMPKITVRVTGPELMGGRPGGTMVNATFEWTARLSFNARDVRHGPQKVVAHPDISAITRVPEYTLQFQKIRGGKLSISVRARVGNQTLLAELNAVNGRPLRILGTNPSRPQLHSAINRKVLRMMVQTESNCRQFDNGFPLFSSDNKGGVGLLQITSPAPTEDEMWDWHANVAAAIRLFEGKLRIAKGCPRSVRASQKFKDLVKKYNDPRQKAGKRPLNIKLPDFTEEQTEVDAVRAFNGLAGTDYFLGEKHLHEFRVRLDDASSNSPNLVVREDPDGVTGHLEWERVPEDVRPAGRGGYVRHALSKGDF